MKAAVFSFIDYAHAAAAQFFCNFVMGEGLSQERLRIRHSVAILGCERNQVNEMARQSLLSPLAAQFFCNFVMGEGLSQERLRIRHSVAILGCERNQVNEMARQSLLSPLAA